MRTSFLGCLIDVLAMADTVELTRRAMRSQQRLQHVALNVAKSVSMRFDPVLAADLVAGGDVISIDGMRIAWGGGALGLRVKLRVTGVDPLTDSLAFYEREGFKPHFLGANPAMLQQAPRTPCGERFLASYCDALGVPFIVGVGGSFDILADAVRWTPVRMQHLGLEWLYRVYPGRMWWRYDKTDTLLAGIVAQAIVRQSLGVAPRANSGRPPGTSRVGR